MTVIMGKAEKLEDHDLAILAQTPPARSTGGAAGHPTDNQDPFASHRTICLRASELAFRGPLFLKIPLNPPFSKGEACPFDSPWARGKVPQSFGSPPLTKGGLGGISPMIHRRCNRNELSTTETELSAMAPAAIIGLSLPRAATGIATVL